MTFAKPMAGGVNFGSPQGVSFRVQKTIRLKIQNCNSPANLNFNELTMFNTSTHFVGNSAPIPHETYFPVVAQDEINVALCPSNTPVILNFYPKSIPAGTKSILTIEGYNFGNVLGEVMFQNADDGGLSMMKALPSDFKVYSPNTTIEWTDSKIELYVPSNELGTSNPAGSGDFVVMTSIGTPVTSPLPLDIPYAVGNFRDGNGIAHRFEMVNDNGIGGYTFHRSVNMNGVNAVDIDHTITWALENWNCETGVTWDLGPTPSSNTNQSNSDGINLIYFAPDTQFSNDVIAFNAASGIRTNSCTGQDGERVDWFVDVDIAIKQSAIWNFPLGTNSGMNTNDFSSVILHELGHSHRLKHAIPREKVMYWMLGQNPPTTSNEGFQTHRVLHQADIDGGVNVLLSSQARIIGGNCSDTPNLIHKNCSTDTHNLKNDISFINVFPNPSLAVFNLELKLKNSLELKIEVLDLLGRSVLRKNFGKLIKGHHLLSISSSNNIPAGTYFLKVNGNNNILNFKIIKL